LLKLKDRKNESFISDNIERDGKGRDKTPKDRQGIALVASRTGDCLWLFIFPCLKF